MGGLLRRKLILQGPQSPDLFEACSRPVRRLFVTSWKPDLQRSELPQGWPNGRQSLNNSVWPALSGSISDFFVLKTRKIFGERFVSDYAHHHPVLGNPAFPARRQIARFCGDFRPLISQILVSAGVHASQRRFWVPCLRIQKFRSRRPASAARRLSYSGLSPSASNCRLHSVGGSRRRSMPMPRGSPEGRGGR